MGARDNYESITHVVQAFATQRTWKQSELARLVGIETRTLRKLLLGLYESGMPLEKDEDHPHVYWSVPLHWFPGGVVFDERDWEVLVHAVLRVPDEARRKQLLARLLSGRRGLGDAREGIERLKGRIAGTPLSRDEHSTLMMIERALMECCPLEINYYSASSGALSERIVSPQRLFYEPHARLVAYCHTKEALRWFRIANIQRVELLLGQEVHHVDQKTLTSYVESSVDGFHDGTEEEFTFIVLPPSAAWVKRNLLSGMKLMKDSSDGLTVVARGAAPVVARFVAGLGGHAVAVSPVLREKVMELAEGCLRAHSL